MFRPMRCVPPLAATLAGVAVIVPASASAATGGASFSETKANRAAGSKAAGGTGYGADIPRPARRPVARLELTSRTMVAGKPLPSVRFRVDQRGVEQVQARVVALRIAGNAPIVRRSAGWVRTGRTVTLRWPKGAVAPRSGRYVVRLHVKDSRGHTLRRTSARPGRTVLRVRPVPAPPRPAPVPTTPAPLLPAPAVSPGGRGVFPIRGPFSFGGAGSRFGTARDGHRHEGQDIAAAAGQPVVAPYAGTISSTDYQAGGAGEYVVLDAVDGRDYFFAHCTRNSTVVRRGQSVPAGAQLCQVGSTGASSGPHLHFEIWRVGWRVPGGAPIDPLPELRSWSGR